MVDKQEMAEWLAENVLGFEHAAELGVWEHREGYNKTVLLHDKVEFPSDQVTPEQFIYSPEGFFAVRQALKKRFGYGTRIEHNFVTDGRETCYICRHADGIEWGGHGADEYEAFYNAVKEACK